MNFFLTTRFVPDGMLGNKLVSGINFYSFFFIYKISLYHFQYRSWGGGIKNGLSDHVQKAGGPGLSF